MSSIVIAGDTSGSVTLQAPAVSGSSVLTLPAVTDTVAGIAATQTLTNKTLTGAVVNGTVGATTPSTGAFTSVTATGNITSSGILQALGTVQSSASADLSLNANGANRDVFVKVNGTTLMTVQGSTANVGIGTSSPIFLTDILSGTANTGANVNNPSQLSVTGANKTLTGGGATVFVNSNSNTAIDTGGSIALTGRNTTSSTTSVVWGVIKGAKENSTSTNGAGYLAFATASHSAGASVEAVRIDSVGNVTLQKNISVGAAAPTTSGTGITFPATQSASTNANTLDDYEEGSFSLTVTSASYTASPASGTYTKIGRLVYCKFFITLTAVNGSSNSKCGFSGLPFTNDGLQVSGSAYEDTTSGSIYVTYVNQNNTLISIQSYSGFTTGSARTLRVNEDYVGFITYQTS